MFYGEVAKKQIKQFGVRLNIDTSLIFVTAGER